MTAHAVTVTRDRRREARRAALAALNGANTRDDAQKPTSGSLSPGAPASSASTTVDRAVYTPPVTGLTPDPSRDTVEGTPPAGAAELLRDVLAALPPAGDRLDTVVRHRAEGAAIALDELAR